MNLFKMVAFLATTASLAWSAQKVYTPHLDLIGVGAKFQYSTVKLLKTYVDEQGDYELILAPRDDAATQAPTKEDAMNQAREMGAGLLLLGDLNAVGEKMVVSFRLIDVNNGDVVWSDRLKASNPDDLDPILMRFGKALGTSNKAAASDDIYSVTYEESKTLRQKKAIRSVGVSIGGLGMPNTAFASSFAPIFDVFAAYDAREFIAEMRGSLILGENPTGASFGINLYYPLSADAMSPYVGGGLAYSTIGHDEVSLDYWGDKTTEYIGESGIIVSLGGGMIFNRTSTIQVRLNGAYQIYTYRVNDQIPHGLKASIDLSWNR